MLNSVKIQRRQSEIRQEIAELVGKETPSDDETRAMDTLDQEYRTNETRFRASLVAEDSERREAGAELETRSGNEWSDLVGKFELRQVALHYNEQRSLTGETNEVVTELRGHGGYQGVPVPWGALEKREGETTSFNVLPHAGKLLSPALSRLFPESVVSKSGGQYVQIDHGTMDYPITVSEVAAGWATGEGANVPGPSPFHTDPRELTPKSTLGVHMRVTRKALKSAPAGLEAAIRQDMTASIAAELDRAAFQGVEPIYEPLGVIASASWYGITETAVDAAVSWSAFRDAVTTFMTNNAASGPDAIKLLIRPEVWSKLDDSLITGTAVSEWDRLVKNIPVKNVAMSSNALNAPSGSPLASKALLTTNVAGGAPFYLGLWGAVDVIRDNFSDAQSGGLRLTGLVTADVTAGRAQQLQVLTGLQI